MQFFTPSAHRLGVASVCSAALLTATALTTEAACIAGSCSQNGLTFSEASSSFRLTDVTGVGTQQDPFVVYQDVLGLDISLAIGGLSNAQQHSIFNRPGFAISIVSRNLTGAFWRFYDHELQETAGQASGENDGLSFAQGVGPVRPYGSSHYAKADEVTDVRDFINFYRGDGVNPGETARFDYYITDTIPNQQFYIRQRPDFRTNTPPTAAVQEIIPQPSALSPQSPNPQPEPAAPKTSAPSMPPAQSIPEPSAIAMAGITPLIRKWFKNNNAHNHN